MRRFNKVILLGIDRIKRWWNGTPVQVRKAHAYSIAGWVRNEDGIYYNGPSTIRRHGHSWIRRSPDLEYPQGGGVSLIGYREESYPTLHAAIGQERPAAETPLLDQGE